MKKILLIVATLMLTACATQAPLKSNTQMLVHQSWQADGVFGYRQADKGFSAGYVWKNNPVGYSIQLIGPLGVWRANLSGDAKHALLMMSDGKVLHAKNPEYLMAENLGWSIPVENLQHWLWATPNPILPGFVSHKANGEVTEIQQAGWNIDYPNYRDHLPSKIILTQGDKKITVVIEHFKYS